jgi:hypothetical protein
MGKCEYATASIGIKILLSELILQINESNFIIIQDMLYDGFIEDENGTCNSMYNQIVRDNALICNYLEYKEYLLTEVQKYNYLRNAYLLLPVKRILNTERWGYNRFGTNGISRPIDFDLSINIDKYKEIQNLQIVFIVKQASD